jgi:hypothetical protein
VLFNLPIYIPEAQEIRHFLPFACNPSLTVVAAQKLWCLNLGLEQAFILLVGGTKIKLEYE